MKNQFLYNPFSGVLTEEVDDIIVPIFDVKSMVDKLNSKDKLLIEFLGDHGRGKTTHLKYLHNNSGFPLFMLNNKEYEFEELLDHPSDTILCDSIHNLSFLERVRLFKHKHKVVFTTHWHRKIESILSSKELQTIRFKGISNEKMELIVERRLMVARLNDEVIPEVNKKHIRNLVKQFGDDYRGIINHLFDEYQGK